jgi:tRNA (guanine37-N1)-methyltransferase
MSIYTKIGDIALLHLPEDKQCKVHEIAQEIIEKEHAVNVVLCTSGRHGEFRKQNVKIVIGDRTDTIHTEYGIRIHVDVKETYFSEKEKTERQRLKTLVLPGERILVLFSGVGSIPLVLAKQKEVDITAVEKNEKAFSLMKENITLNSLKGSITPVLQDVYTFDSKEFDRVIAPQPYRHTSFDTAKKFVTRKGFLHYYTWVTSKQDLPAFAGFHIIRTKRLDSYAPGVWKVCVDMQKL